MNENNSYILTGMNNDAAKQISRWKYLGEYAVYNSPDFDGGKNGDSYLCFWDEDSNLIAYIHYSEKRNNTVFIGIGLVPDCCGRGLGRDILAKGISVAALKYPGCFIKLQVRSWNIRAIKCYLSAGFAIEKEESVLDHRGEHEKFTFMEYKRLAP